MLRSGRGVRATTLDDREDVRRAVGGAGREGRDASGWFGHRRRARRGDSCHRQEAGRGGRRVLDGGRARGTRAGGRGDQPAPVPRPGPDAGHRHHHRRRLRAPLRNTMTLPTNGNRLRIAVPNKGSLSQAAIEMLHESGYRQRNDAKQLTLVDAENAVEFYYLRPRDIALYVGEGTLDVGITGRDLLLDSGAKAEEGLRLGFGRSRYLLAGPAGEFTDLAQLAGKRVATSYVGVVRKYLEDQGVDATVVRLDGAVETSVRLGVADAIADVVQTGSTLREA